MVLRSLHQVLVSLTVFLETGTQRVLLLLLLGSRTVVLCEGVGMLLLLFFTDLVLQECLRWRDNFACGMRDSISHGIYFHV